MRRGRLASRSTTSDFSRYFLTRMIMKRNSLLVMLTALVAVIASARSGYAQQPSEARIRELIRLAAERAAQQAAPAAAPAAQAAPDTRPVVHMSLEDAIKAALDNNLDIT